MTEDKSKQKKQPKDKSEEKNKLFEEGKKAERAEKQREQRDEFIPPKTARSAPPPEFFKARDKFREILDEEVKPKTPDFTVLTLLTKELIKHGDYTIRFVEELDDSEPTLLVSVNLPRGVLPGDPEVFALHEIAQRITEKTGTNLIVTTTGVGAGGRRIDYSPGKVARAVGKNLLADMPNLYACENQLRMAFVELELEGGFSDVGDVLENLDVLARIYFHLGLKQQALQAIDRIEKVLETLLEGVKEGALGYSIVYGRLNDAAILCSVVGEYDRAFQLIDDNFVQLAEFVEKHDLVRRREDPSDKAATELYLHLPDDLTFSRQEMREKVFFYKEKAEYVVKNCPSTLDMALNLLSRAKDNYE